MGDGSYEHPGCSGCRIGAWSDSFVTNGIYSAGGQIDPNGNFDVVVADESLIIQSINGPSVTLIDGGGAATCVYLTNKTLLVGFTLTNGFACTATTEGGVRIHYRRVVQLRADRQLDLGAYGGTLNRCMVSGNSGDGADYCTLNNCTLTGNSGYGPQTAR